MREREPGPWRLILTLGGAGWLAGALLVGVYLATDPSIQRNRARALFAAAQRVLPGAERIEAWLFKEGEPVRYEGPRDVPPPPGALFAGYGPDGTLVGVAIPAEGPGFQDTIRLVYGFDPQRRLVIGLEVLESRETPGLGDKIAYDPDFLANFGALEVEPEVVAVRRGEKRRPHEVDCITGATISSEAVVAILNRSLEAWLPRLERAAERMRERTGA